MLLYQKNPSSQGWKFTLLEDFYFTLPKDCGNHEYADKDSKVWLLINGRVGKISRGYSWDGATPKFNFFGLFWFGVWDTEDNIEATLIHDALLQFHKLKCFPLVRREIDIIFLDKMPAFCLRNLYYAAVALYTATAYRLESDKPKSEGLFCTKAPKVPNKSFRQ